MRKLLVLGAACIVACGGGGGGSGGGGPRAGVEVEPNDTIAQANQVGLNTTILGTNTNGIDVDFFQIDVPANTFVVVRTLDGSGVNCDGTFPIFDLYDSTGASIARAPYNGLTDFCQVLSLAGGGAGATYYVRISSPWVTPTDFVFDYRLQVTAPSAPAATATETEPNGTSSDADRNAYLTGDVLVSADLPASDADFYYVQNTSASTVNVHAETFVGGFGSCGSPGDTLLQVWYANGLHRLNDDSGLGTCSALDFQMPPSTKFLLLVTSSYTFQFSYQLWIDFF